MIAVWLVRATCNLPRRSLLLAAPFVAASGCSVASLPPSVAPPSVTDGHFTLRDGVRLPYRRWLPPLPEGTPSPWAVALALHGFNDSRDAWEIPAPWFLQAGIGLYAPDQRGFGAAPDRGRWPGTAQLVADAADMAASVARAHPASRLYLIGESMGGAVLMCLAASDAAPRVSGYVLSAPAVWGGAAMNPLYRVTLRILASLAPGMVLTGRVAGVIASDNRAALIRLSTDPLTLHGARVDTLEGLVDLMGTALDASPRLRGPALVLYGGRDQLVPRPAMAAAWRGIAANGDGEVRLAYYPPQYHLLLRDTERARPLGDIISWIYNQSADLPSEADRQARLFLAAT